jgi:argininosuccinate synthase
MKKGLDVITFTGNVGQRANLESIGERAIELGAESAHIQDLRERFVKDFCFAALRAGAVYESGYYLGTALTRPLMIEEMVKIAREDGAEYLAHGCAGRGNDRVRFAAAAAAISPDLTLLAPLEEWGLSTREEQRRYAERYGMTSVLAEAGARERGVAAPVEGADGADGADGAGSVDGAGDGPPRRRTPPVDWHRWGIAHSHEAAAADPWEPVPEAVYQMTVAPDVAPVAPQDIRIAFKRGTPTRLDGRRHSPVEIVEALNAIGGRHGIGRREVMEDRISGIKTREIYEAPASQILYEAHKALESLVLSKELVHFKGLLSKKYAELVYGGLWFHELRHALDGFFGQVRETATGEVRLRLFKGRVAARGVRSPYSLYDRGLARLAAAEAEGEELSGVREAVCYALRHEAHQKGAVPPAQGRRPPAAP